MGTAHDVLRIAAGELGSAERPAGSNCTKYGQWYGLDGYSWCMIFVQWCFAQAGVKLPKRTASCGDLMRSAQGAGCWITSGFQPGDVVIYDFPGGAATDHCGIVESVAGADVTAIEGNTSEQGSQSNGGMVCRKRRAGKLIVGAVRPAFEEKKEEETVDAEKFRELWMALRREFQESAGGQWSQEARDWAVNSGLISGSGKLPDGSPNYMWEDVMTREQLAAVLYRFAKLAGLTDGGARPQQSDGA